MAQQTGKTGQPKDNRDALEWLYIMFTAGGLLIAISLIILTFFITGRLSQQSEIISRLTTAVAELETAQRRIEKSVAERKSVSSKPESTPRRNDAVGSEKSASTSRPSAAAQPGTSPQTSLTDATIRQRYEQLVGEDENAGPIVHDAAGARTLLNQAADDDARNVERSGAAWQMLATLSRLTGDDAAAERYADRAAALGQSLDAFWESSARRALAADQPASALKFARRLSVAADADETHSALADLLLAAALDASAEWAEMRRVCPVPRRAASLGNADRLLLGHLYVDLERWDDLQTLLGLFGELPESQAMQRDFLRGVWLAVKGQSAEAVAVLDFVLERRPEHYEAQVWRGVALTRAKQPQAARMTLSKATATSPGRPQAWYWLAVLEMNDGNTAEGTQYLHNALAASARFAPAWEALAALALNSNDLAAVSDHCRRAIESDAERPEAYFLLAVCKSRQSSREDALNALVRAVSLDPALVERAMQTESLAKMFDRAELEAAAHLHHPASRPATQTRP